MELGKHNPFKYIKPWSLWFPFPLFNDTFQYFFNGIGLATATSSVEFDNIYILMIGYDIASQFLQTQLDMTFNDLLYPINFQFGSDIVYSTYYFIYRLQYLLHYFLIQYIITILFIIKVPLIGNFLLGL